MSPGKHKPNHPAWLVRWLMFICTSILLLTTNFKLIGRNASFHWDTADYLAPRSQQVHTNADTLRDAYLHVFDLRTQYPNETAKEITRRWQSDDNPTRQYLVSIRNFYRQGAYILNNIAITAATHLSTTPATSIAIYQIGAIALFALATNYLVSTFSFNRRHHTHLISIALTAAWLTTPTSAGIARQILSESVTWAILALFVCSCNYSFKSERWHFNPAGSFLAGTAAYLAARSNYNIAPLLPILLAITLPRQWLNDYRSIIANLPQILARFLAPFFFSFIVLCGLDAYYYGPWMAPWNYKVAMVDTAIWFFSDDSRQTQAHALFTSAFPIILGILAFLFSLRDTVRRPTPANVVLFLALLAPLSLIVLSVITPIGVQDRHIWLFSAVLFLGTIKSLYNSCNSRRIIYYGLAATFFPLNLYSLQITQPASATHSANGDHFRIFGYDGKCFNLTMSLSSITNGYYDNSNWPYFRPGLEILRHIQDSKPSVLYIDEGTQDPWSYYILASRFKKELRIEAFHSLPPEPNREIDTFVLTTDIWPVQQCFYTEPVTHILTDITSELYLVRLISKDHQAEYFDAGSSHAETNSRRISITQGLPYNWGTSPPPRLASIVYDPQAIVGVIDVPPQAQHGELSLRIVDHDRQRRTATIRISDSEDFTLAEEQYVSNGSTPVILTVSLDLPHPNEHALKFSIINGPGSPNAVVSDILFKWATGPTCGLHDPRIETPTL